MAWTLFPVAGFAEFGDRWQRLNLAGPNSPLLRPEFVGPLVAAFARRDEIIAVHGDPGAPNAMGIFARAGPFAWQTFQPAVSPLGMWLAPGGAPVDLLRSLAAALPGLTILVGVTQQDPLVTPRPPCADRVRTLDYIRTARIGISEDFATYWGSLGKNLRHTIKRLQNRIDRENVDVHLDIKTEPGEMPDAVAAYSRLESAGWKGRAGTAVLGDDDQGRFYAAMMQAFCRDGCGLVCQLRLAGRLVATDICIHDGKTVIVLKTTYDEAAKAWSPAQLMRYMVFQKFFDEFKFRTIEFYGPVKDWHSKLSSDVRTMYHINFYRLPMFAGVHGLLQQRRQRSDEAPAAA
jgi:CelD/BcsL family acetyltransferase involved in cellulose biosynthesis